MNRKLVVTAIASLMLLPICSVSSSAVKTPNLVAGYQMEETAGTSLADFSTGGGGHVGTASGTTIVTGHAGRARSFNGTSDKVSIADAAVLRLSTFTLSAWVKPAALPASGKKWFYSRKTMPSEMRITP